MWVRHVIISNHKRDFLLGILQRMTFICYLAESLVCLKYSWRLKHLSFKWIFLANWILRFHLLDFLFKSGLFSVKNTFVVKKIFVADLICCFQSIWFLIWKTINFRFSLLWLNYNWSYAIASVIASDGMPTIKDGACNYHTRSNFLTIKSASLSFTFQVANLMFIILCYFTTPKVALGGLLPKLLASLKRFLIFFYLFTCLFICLLV